MIDDDVGDDRWKKPSKYRKRNRAEHIMYAVPGQPSEKLHCKNCCGIPGTGFEEMEVASVADSWPGLGKG